MNDQTQQVAEMPTGAASVLDDGLERRPLPGGIALTVVERCELYDWKDACVEAAVARAIAVEREACAKICEQLSHIGSENQLWMRDRCVSAIRQRSNVQGDRRPATTDGEKGGEA